MTATVDERGSDAVVRFVDAVVGHRPAQARAIVADTLGRLGPIGTIERLLAPAQLHVGELWLASLATSADEHRVSAVVDEVLEQLRRDSRDVPTGPSIAVSTGVGDWHATAARMATLHLRAAGWDARFVGVSLDHARLAEAQQLGDIEAVALSCVAAPHLLGVARSIRLARAAGVPVMVGGQAFSADPRRARRLGADAGPTLQPPPVAENGTWLTAGVVAAEPGSLHPRLDAVLDLDLGIVTYQLQAALADEPIGSDPGLAAALLRPAVDAWGSALAVGEPAILTAQFDWSASYLAARGAPLDHVRALAAGMRAVLPVDPGEVLRSAAAPG